MLLIVTGESISPATQAPSHGAGQTRPVNSGKLFVCAFAGQVPACEENSGVRRNKNEATCAYTYVTTLSHLWSRRLNSRFSLQRFGFRGNQA